MGYFCRFPFHAFFFLAIILGTILGLHDAEAQVSPGDILYLDGRTVYKLNPGSGAPVMFSDFRNAAQGNIGCAGGSCSPRSLAVEPGTGRIVVASVGIDQVSQTGQGWIYLLDPTNGNRSVLTHAPIAQFSPGRIAFEAGGTLLVADQFGGKVDRVANDGTISVLSDFSNSGQGEVGNDIEGLAVDSLGRILVTTSNGAQHDNGTVLEIDSVSGFRYLVTDCFDKTVGIQCIDPVGMALESSGAALFADINGGTQMEPDGDVITGNGTVLRVHNGARSVLTDFQFWPGAGFCGIVGTADLAMDSGGTLWLVTNNSGSPNCFGEVIRINTNSGFASRRTGLSECCGIGIAVYPPPPPPQFGCINDSDCVAFDQCHVSGAAGACNSATGLCFNPAKPDGAACDDGDACTQSDTCQSGACVGANPVVCSALDSCHQAGTCSTTSGDCSNPPKVDTSCNFPLVLANGKGLYLVDPTSGDRSLVSDFHNAAQGPLLNYGTGLSVEPSGKILVADQFPSVASLGAIFRIDPTQTGAGNRSLVASWDTAPGADGGGGPFRVVRESSSSVVVTTQSGGTNSIGTLLRVDLTSGSLTLLNDFGDSSQGPVGSNIAGVAMPAPNHFLVVDSDAGTNFSGAIFRVDCDSSNPPNCTRTLAADFGDANGDVGENPSGVALDSSGLLYVTDQFGGVAFNGAIFRVDTNQVLPWPHVLASDWGNTLQGPSYFAFPSGVTIDGAGKLWVAAQSGGPANDGELWLVDPGSGTRSVVSSLGDKEQGATGGTAFDVGFYSQSAGGGCGADSDCNDSEVCTADTCNLGTHVCQFNPIAGCCHSDAECNDSNACTADSCSSSGGTPTCQHQDISASCTDGNPCTDDSCDPVTGCKHANNTASCDDGNACTTGDICGGGTCQAGSAVSCNDGNPCTDDSCNPATGCMHANNTASCDDGNACTTGDICSGGTCTPGSAANCNDGNPCTDDSCNPASGCTHSNNAASCDDGNACTTGDSCSGGSCKPGSAINCSDGNICTDDSCNPATGCSHVNNTAACDDANACTVGDSCLGGSCKPGSSISCNDGNACTDDSCNPASGCAHANNTASCNDGNACTTTDSCGGGTCSGTPVVCAAVDACHIAGSCDPGTGLCSNPTSDACNDHNACTLDSCKAKKGSGAASCTHTCSNAGACKKVKGQCPVVPE